jgi:cytoplasmic iron level regulating protein YaaA (DUF328/UPF0246 family)
VKRKLPTPAAAQDLYASQWFKKAKLYAISRAAEWYILSAEYGLLHPQTLIAPYERTLGDMSVSERRSWAKAVLENLQMAVGAGDHIVLLAGRRYREFLIEPLLALGCSVDVPMAGMRRGEQLRWLARELTRPHAN